MKRKDINDDLTKPDTLSPAEVIHVNKDGMSGMVFINGENWRFKSKLKVKKGDTVTVLSYKSLTLEVSPLEQKGSSD